MTGSSHNYVERQEFTIVRKKQKEVMEEEEEAMRQKGTFIIIDHIPRLLERI